MVKYLIEETDCIVNHVNHRGETALYKSLELQLSDEIVTSLIKAGADVNKATNSLVTPLHEAVKQNSKVAHVLIESGADVNALEGLGNYTPLHVAVERDLYEQVCMLLYYGADTTILNSFGMTPFMCAASIDADIEIQELLLEYEIDVNLKALNGYSTLLLSMNYRSPLALELIYRGADIYYSFGGANVLTFLFAYEDNVIFEKLWSMIKPELLFEVHSEIQNFFDVGLSDDDFKRRINIVLCSNKAEVVIQKYEHILSYLIPTCHRHHMKEEEVLPLVSICLMYGAVPTYKNVCTTFRRYGYHQILKLLLHMGIPMNFCYEDIILPYFICYVSPYVRGINDSHCRMCIRVNRKKKETECTSRYITYIFTLCQSCRLFYIGEKCQVPSLKELSRLATRRAIALRFNTKNTLMFYTIVKHLNIPTIIKQLISYEIPII